MTVTALGRTLYERGGGAGGEWTDSILLCSGSWLCSGSPHMGSAAWIGVQRGVSSVMSSSMAGEDGRF